MINSIVRQAQQATQTLQHVRNVVESGFETAKEASKDQRNNITVKLQELIPVLQQFYIDQPVVAVFCGWMFVLNIVPMTLFVLTAAGLVAGWLFVGALLTLCSLLVSGLFIILPMLTANFFISLGLTATTLTVVTAFRYMRQRSLQQQYTFSGIEYNNNSKLLQFKNDNESTDPSVECADLLLKEE